MRAAWRAPRSRRVPLFTARRRRFHCPVKAVAGASRRRARWCGRKKVLLATNGLTYDLWPGLRRTIVPVFSSITATAPLSDDVARAIMPTRPVLYESGYITVYYRIDAHIAC